MSDRLQVRAIAIVGAFLAGWATAVWCGAATTADREYEQLVEEGAFG